MEFLNMWQEAVRILPPSVWMVFSFFFGAIIGSFLNVCVHRMPRGHSVADGRSRCYACGKTIRWYDNLPLVSFFILQGKCRDCGARFSIRYWLVELLTAI